MIIDIPNDSELSDATVISGFPIDEEEEVESPEVQQPELQLDIDLMARTMEQPTPMTAPRPIAAPRPGNATINIPTPSSCPVPNPVQIPPATPVDAHPVREARQDREGTPKEAYQPMIPRKHNARVVPENTDKVPMEEDPEEDDLMEEDSPPNKGPDAEDDDKNFPHYV